MKIVVAASPSVAIPTIQALESSKHDLFSIVTQPDKPAGRGRDLTPTPIGSKYNALKPQSEVELQSILEGSDLLITIGYGKLLNISTLKIPKFGGINLHFSLLPMWRGAAPVQRAIEAGDKETGVTVFQMDEGMDTGPIWRKIQLPIKDESYAQDIFEELSILGATAVMETLDLIDKETPIAQSGVSTIAKKIAKNELEINWKSPAVVIRNKIRGLGPNTFTNFRGQKLTISKVDFSELELKPGELFVKEKKLFIGTADKALQILTLTPSGKKQLSGSDFANGARLNPGDVVA